MWLAIESRNVESENAPEIILQLGLLPQIQMSYYLDISFYMTHLYQLLYIDGVDASSKLNLHGS